MRTLASTPRPVRLTALVLLTALALGGCDLLFSRTPGEKLWRKHCMECHGVDARGNTPRYMGNPWADLRDNAWKTAGDRSTVETVVREGVFAKMPANEELTAEEMRHLLDYFYELRGESE